MDPLSGKVARPIFTGIKASEARRRAAGEPERTHEEIMASAWGRPRHQWTPWPKVGDRVSFTKDEWGEAVPATVLQVQAPTDDDPNINHRVRKHPRTGKSTHLVPRDDGMPWVILKTDDGYTTKTREARVRGACGWRATGGSA